MIIGYFGYYFSRNNFIVQTEAVIDAEIRYVAEQSEAKRIQSLAHVPYNRAYLLFDKSGNSIAGNLSKLPDQIQVLAEGVLLFEWRHKTYAAKILTFANNQRFLAGVDVTEAYHDSRMMITLSVISIVLMIVVIMVSFLISSFVVGRTRYIAGIAEDIMRTGDLSRRIDIISNWDDIGYMAQVLNELLARVEGLMNNVKQVSDNIAHDLRTPLTRLRNRLETMSQMLSARNDHELCLACDEIQADADQLLQTFHALLRIANIEAGKQKDDFIDIAMEDMVRDVVELYEPLAEAKHIKLVYDAIPFTYRGDRDLLFQMMANIMDNAIKFTPSQGCVSVTLMPGMVTVTDTGPGVNDEDKEKIFNRFYRCETSRNSPGNGLGLSLVAAVASMHDISVVLKDNMPGLSVSLEFQGLLK